MSYPKGVKGYCLCDSGSGTFFVVRDIIFNKDLLGNITDDDEKEESIAPPTPPTVTSQTIVAQVPGTSTSTTLIPIPAVAALPLVMPCRSVHACNMTEAGRAFAEDHVAAKAHLEELQDKHACVLAQEMSVDSLQGSPSSLEGVNDDKHVHTDSLRPIESNSDVSDLTTDVIIREQAHVIKEQAHITIRSDKHRDSSSLDYNMLIPPATYNEAVQ